MVVDDHEMIRRLLVRLFSGHDVCEVGDIRRAIAILREGRHIDVIVSDIMMPGGSGVDFYRVLERSDPLLASRMVFITAGDMSGDMEECLRRSGRPVVAKPFNADKIRATVEQSALHNDWATLVGLGARQRHSQSSG